MNGLEIIGPVVLILFGVTMWHVFDKREVNVSEKLTVYVIRVAAPMDAIRALGWCSAEKEKAEMLLDVGAILDVKQEED